MNMYHYMNAYIDALVGAGCLGLLLCLLYAVYNRYFAKYHIRVSDTKKTYLQLQFKNFKDELAIYTVCYGRQIYLKCTQDCEYVYSRNIVVPPEYDNPYVYVMSGDLDDEIRDLRILADMKVTSLKPGKSVVDSDNYEILKRIPIEFEDVGDLIRQRLGVKVKR